MYILTFFSFAPWAYGLASRGTLQAGNASLWNIYYISHAYLLYQLSKGLYSAQLLERKMTSSLLTIT